MVGGGSGRIFQGSTAPARCLPQVDLRGVGEHFRKYQDLPRGREADRSGDKGCSEVGELLRLLPLSALLRFSPLPGSGMSAFYLLTFVSKLLLPFLLPISPRPPNKSGSDAGEKKGAGQNAEAFHTRLRPRLPRSGSQGPGSVFPEVAHNSRSQFWEPSAIFWLLG